MSVEIYDANYLNFYNLHKCIGDLGEKWCHFKWRIYNPHLIPQRRIRSPVFTTRLFPTTHWFLKVRLSSPGEIRTLEISLSRFINYEKDPLIVDVIYKIISDEEVDTSSKKIIEYYNRRVDDINPFFASFYKSKNNYLTIECKLRPNKQMIQDVCHHNLDTTLPIHLRNLLQTGELYDTIICVRKYQIKAHIAILEARLPQLLEKCHARSKKKGKHIVVLHDLPLSVVKEMLKYAYTGQACVDVDSFPISKDVYIYYSQDFFHSCCWEDHPFAKTFFNYETDSLSWYMKDFFEKSHLGSKSIDLLRLYPSKFRFSLNIEELEKDKKCLMLTLEFLHEQMPKPTVVSCNTFLVNTKNNERLELGETESLLEFRITKRKMNLGSVDDVKKKCETLCSKDNCLFLQADLKFCYGSCISSIENLYEGQFDISKCTGCPQLSADLEYLYRSKLYYNIILESADGYEIFAHKAILRARWPAADRLELEHKIHVVLAEHGKKALDNFILKLYKGFT